MVEKDGQHTVLLYQSSFLVCRRWTTIRERSGFLPKNGSKRCFNLLYICFKKTLMFPRHFSIFTVRELLCFFKAFAVSIISRNLFKWLLCQDIEYFIDQIHHAFDFLSLWALAHSAHLIVKRNSCSIPNRDLTGFCSGLLNGCHKDQIGFSDVCDCKNPFKSLNHIAHTDARTINCSLLRYRIRLLR